MKYALALLLTLTFAQADHVNKKSLACPNVMLLQKAPVHDGTSGLDMTFYSIANNCIVLTKKDHLEALGYDLRNSKEIFQKVIHTKTGAEVIVLKNNLVVEQGGKYNRIRF